MRYGLLIAIASLATQAPLSAAEPVYQNDFEQVEAGSEPDDFLIIDGAFTVKEEGGNKFLELPGAPLDSFSAMFALSSCNIVSLADVNAVGKPWICTRVDSQVTKTVRWPTVVYE